MAMDRRHLTVALFCLPLALAAGRAMAGPTGGEARPDDIQLRMALVTATVLRRSGRRGIMSVEVTLQFSDAALLERAKLSEPRLNAAFNEAIQIEAARMLPNAVPDLQTITGALQRATDRVLGRAGARVLLGTVMVT